MAFLLIASFVVGAVALAAIGLRFRYLRPASLAFADSRSAELWQELRRQRPLLVFTDSVLLAAEQHLPDTRGMLQADAHRVFIHFGSDKRAVVPAVCVYEVGRAYLIEVAYRDELARVLLAVLAGLRPLCAITMGRQRPVHPALLWLQLLWKLDGPPWFVLCSVMTPERQMQFLYDRCEPLEACEGEHAGA